jgi:mannitol/fructose-specific phosphotransferase system IIA component (Ntr-type)
MGRPLLCEENIIAGLDASDREDALKKIIDALPPWTLKQTSKKNILELLFLRERIGTTAIGHGIALPHCFSSDVTEPIVAFGVSPDGIPYPSLDSRPVHFVFLLILPQSEAAEHRKRQILQNIKWFLCDRYMQERLKSARSASEIYQLVVPDRQQAPAFAF